MQDSLKNKAKSDQSETPQKDSKFKEIIKRIFVHNIGYKCFAVFMSLLCWFLVVALN